MRRIALFALVAGALLLSAGLTAPPASAQPNPAQSLVGQTITACNEPTKFRFSVVSADWRTTIIDRSQPGSMWAVAVVDATNVGLTTDYVQGLVVVRDNQGRISDWVLFNGLDNYVEVEIAAEYRVTPSWMGVDPGRTMRTVLTFLVPSDARSLVLIPAEYECIGDITPPPAGSAPAPRPAPAPAPAAPAPSAPTTSAPPPAGGGAARTPASSLTGQSVTACKGEERYRFTVVEAYWDSLLVDRSQPGYVWAIAVVDVTTLSPGLGYFQGIISVRDNRGRQVDWTLFNGPDIYVEDALAAAYYVQPSWMAAGPVGQTVRTVAPFLVSEDATSLTLIPYNIGCGG